MQRHVLGPQAERQAVAHRGAAPHTHPNEQWIYLLAGKLRAVVDGEERELSPSELMYIPAGIVHSVDALPGADARFFTCKDLRHGITGTPVETA
ncbi:MAG: cupin domain-containing protein [Defluviicoccus sp.]|nr:cupin domain-containing protein [Defluviicoccus sp.]MDE0382255.1 cupin domain-containing protein [Defluviicoccus sp.]